MIYSRKQFLQNSAILFAAAMSHSAFAGKNNKPLLAFTTLGCPDWSFQQIVDFASANDYTGLEIRGIKRQMDDERKGLKIYKPRSISQYALSGRARKRKKYG
jgi:hypothetical protein